MHYRNYDRQLCFYSSSGLDRVEFGLIRLFVVRAGYIGDWISCFDLSGFPASLSCSMASRIESE